MTLTYQTHLTINYAFAKFAKFFDTFTFTTFPTRTHVHTYTRTHVHMDEYKESVRVSNEYDDFVLTPCEDQLRGQKLVEAQQRQAAFDEDIAKSFARKIMRVEAVDAHTPAAVKKGTIREGVLFDVHVEDEKLFEEYPALQKEFAKFTAINPITNAAEYAITKERYDKMRQECLMDYIQFTRTDEQVEALRRHDEWKREQLQRLFEKKRQEAKRFGIPFDASRYASLLNPDNLTTTDTILARLKKEKHEKREMERIIRSGTDEEKRELRRRQAVARRKNRHFKRHTEEDAPSMFQLVEFTEASPVLGSRK